MEAPVKKLWVYRVVVLLLAAGLGAAIFMKKDSCQVVAEDVSAVSGWRTIGPEDVEDNFVRLLRENMGLLTAGEPGRTNSMTIGWGAFGTLWSVPVFNVYVSPDRYTHGFMEEFETYTVSFLSERHRDDVIYLGTHSGRDGDKISQTSLTLEYTVNGTPYFEEAFMVIECRKQYGAQFEDSRLGEIPSGFYEKVPVGVHSAYVGQIMQIMVNDDNR